MGALFQTATWPLTRANARIQRDMTQLEGDVAVSLRSTHIAGHGVPIASVVCRESLGSSFSTMFVQHFQVYAVSQSRRQVQLSNCVAVVCSLMFLRDITPYLTRLIRPPTNRS